MSLNQRLGNATNVLLLVPSMVEAEADACHDLLTPRKPELQNVLYLEFTLSPEVILEAWHNGGDGRPGDIRIVRMGTEKWPQQAPEEKNGSDTDSEYIEYGFATASDPGSLVRIGSTLESIMNGWADDPRHTVLCVHSLTAFLQYVELQQAFRFLNVLTEQVGHVGALAHYHMDPTAHDPREVNVLRQLFDAVVEIDPDGEDTVMSQSHRSELRRV